MRQQSHPSLASTREPDAGRGGVTSRRVVVACPSPLGVFEQSLALQEIGILGTVAIGFYSKLDRRPLSLVPSGRVRGYLAKRHHPGLRSDLVRMNPTYSLLLEAARKLLPRLRYETILFPANRAFDRWVSRHLAEFGDMVLGYESSSLLTFREAKRLGYPTVLYQPIPVAEFAQTLLKEEARRWPALAGTLRYAYFPPKELARRKEERVLADLILCASDFTKESLVNEGVPGEKIRVVSYGVDQERFAPNTNKFERFSVIWAGSFTQTKGIGYLLEALALKAVPDAELVLAGHPYGLDPVTAYEDRVHVRRIGHLPREALARVMARCHVHVFPTLIDGFGRNIIEAMASGLPVIATPHCAAPSLIQDGVTGFIVPIRDPGAISERLVWVAGHPDEARQMGLRARASVAHLTPDAYRRRFASEILAFGHPSAS